MEVYRVEGVVKTSVGDRRVYEIREVEEPYGQQVAVAEVLENHKGLHWVVGPHVRKVRQKECVRDGVRE